MQDYLKTELLKRIEKVYNNDPLEIREFQEELYRSGLTFPEVEQAITDFRLKTPWLV